jgi:hypothetical protein
MTQLPGISGSLLPSRFLAGLGPSLGLASPTRPKDGRIEPRLQRWWQRVETRCGPATGLYALFDLVAMPLVGWLGFRARDAVFRRDSVVAQLRTPGGTVVGLILLPWAARPSQLWRDLERDARALDVDWCLLLSPPFASLVDTRGHATRRSLDFRLPDAFCPESLPFFRGVCRAEAFDDEPSAPDRGGPIVERLLRQAESFQEAVRQDLQVGVVRALASLGPVLRRNAGAVHEIDEALTLVYRILFLLFAESRHLVPVRHPAYRLAYGITTFCRETARGGDATGLWEGLAAVTRLSRSGCGTTDLIVSPFNGRLFARASAPSLEARSPSRLPTRASRRRDRAIADALLALGTRRSPVGREEISYADLGVEQLGAVYERVLDLDPTQLLDAGASGAPSSSGSVHSARRKETGTFYTPQPLTDFVVRRTLAPLVRGRSADDLLKLRVVDPAMGSGAFLVAACRYLAHAYESALVREGRYAEPDFDEPTRAGIRRLIAIRCLAGVDVNPVAVQLARLSMWLTTLARDRPLNFLDDRLRVGDSLIGVSPDDLWRTGRGASGARRTHDTPLFEAGGLETAVRDLARPLRDLRHGRDETVGEVRAREHAWSRLTGPDSPLQPWRLACDLWCARWFWPPDAGPAPSPPELAAALDRLLRDDTTLGSATVSRWIDAARAASCDRRFFHWPLEFLDAFYDEDGRPAREPGFDAVIGNPPWEMLRRDGSGPPDSGRDRRRIIHFIRQSGQYELCDKGHLNLYQPFVERSLAIARTGGRVGLVVPWGMASDDGASALRRRLIGSGEVDSLVGLDNGAGLFPIHRGLRFLVLAANSRTKAGNIRATFGVRTAAELDALPGEDEAGDRSAFPVRLSADAVRLAGGTSLRIPDSRTPGDVEWLVRIARRFPRLGDRRGWAVEFGRELNATEDRACFGDRGLPVIEGKHVGPFSVQATAERRIRPELADRRFRDGRHRRARLAYRDVSGVGNRLALIAAVVPAGVVTTHTLFCLRTALPPEQQHFLCGVFNSETANRFVRLLMGSHVTTGLIEALPVPAWTGDPTQCRIAEIAARLADEPAAGDALDDLHALVAAMYAS